MRENIIKKLVNGLLKPINTSAVSILGIYTILWGVWVANPFWHVFSTAALYSQLNSIAPEVFWGLLAIVIGIITMYGVIRPSYRSLTMGALAVGWHWWMISLLYFMGDWQNTGGITAGIFFVYGCFIWLNLRVNKRRWNWTYKQADNELRFRKRKQY